MKFEVRLKRYSVTKLDLLQYENEVIIGVSAIKESERRGAPVSTHTHTRFVLTKNITYAAFKLLCTERLKLELPY